MTPPDAAVVAALDTLVERMIAAGPLYTEHDPDWPSPCELDEPDARGRVRWAPVRRSAFDLLEPLAATLNVELHPSLSSYYSRWFHDGLAAEADEGPVDLLGVWNPEDQDRLLQNLLGHALQQKRTRQPLTLFFALTEPDSEFILSVLNDTGEVVLERPGKPDRRTVADDLASFLGRLRPAPREG
jgi:SecY interacting protein Syd